MTKETTYHIRLAIARIEEQLQQSQNLPSNVEYGGYEALALLKQKLVEGAWQHYLASSSLRPASTTSTDGQLRYIPWSPARDGYVLPTINLTSNNMTNTFLPTDYTVPKSGGNYMKFLPGDNRFRILSGFHDYAIMGWEYWGADKKPVRTKMNAKPTAEQLENSDGKAVKHFWAMPVWDYRESKVKVLEITQSTIQDALQAYAADEDWGNPTEYDISITKKGEGKDTEYTIVPKPKKKIAVEIQEEWKEIQKNGFDMKLLFQGDHPFTGTVSSPKTSEDEPLPPEEVNIDDIEF